MLKRLTFCGFILLEEWFIVASTYGADNSLGPAKDVHVSADKWGWRGIIKRAYNKQKRHGGFVKRNQSKLRRG